MKTTRAQLDAEILRLVRDGKYEGAVECYALQTKSELVGAVRYVKRLAADNGLSQDLINKLRQTRQVVDGVSAPARDENTRPFTVLIESMKEGVGSAVMSGLFAVALGLVATIVGSFLSNHLGSSMKDLVFVIVVLGLVLTPIVVTIKSVVAPWRKRAALIRAHQSARSDAFAEEMASLETLKTSAESHIVSLRDLLPQAAADLDRADRDFSERAFAPFWDAIESAARALANYHSGVTKIRDASVEHALRAGILPEMPSRLEIATGDFPDARPVAQRLASTVRKAQKDFEFATIYEQRKTNQLLFAGFQTLAAAIDHMQESIASALSDLAETVGASLETLVDSSKTQAAALASMSEDLASRGDKLSDIAQEHLLERRKQTELLKKNH